MPDTVVDAVTRRLPSTYPHLRDAVVRTRVKLTVVTRPGVTWPAVGQVNLDLAARTVRAQVAAASPAELVDLLLARLHASLDGASRRRDGRPRRWPAQLNHLADVARHDGERAVLRRKTYWLSRLTPDEAVDELEDLDYDVHLFVEHTTGSDAVVHRTRDGYRLTLGTGPPPGFGTRGRLLVNRRAPLTLSVAAAKVRIDTFGLPFLFFLDDATGRGTVLYHRYDGHLGLLTSTG